MKKILVILLLLSLKSFGQGTPQALDTYATPLFKSLDLRKQTTVSTPSLGIRLGNIGSSLMYRDSLGNVQTLPTLSKNNIFTGSNAYGTPSSIVLSNGTGLPISTGVTGLGTGISTFLTTPSSSNLYSSLTTKTGTGLAVFSYNPTLSQINLNRQTTAATPTTGINISNINGNLSIKDSTGVVLTVVTTPINQGDVYLDGVNGDDSYNGRTVTTPVKSISVALSKLSNNTTLWVARNSHFRGTLDLTTFTNVIVQDYGAGEKPIFDALDVFPNANIEAVGGYTNVYRMTVYMWGASTANRQYASLFEDDIRYNETIIGDAGITDSLTALTYLQNKLGTFYFAGSGTQTAGWASGYKRIYFSDSEDPRTNGRIYEFGARKIGIDLGGCNGTMINMINRGSIHHDGLSSNGKWKFDGVEVRNFSRHGMIVNRGAILNCTVRGNNPKYPGYNIHVLRDYSAFVADDIILIENPKIYNTSSTPSVGIGGHASGTGSGAAFDKVIVNNAEMWGVSSSVGVADCNYLYVDGLKSYNSQQLVSAVTLKLTKLKNFSFVSNDITDLVGPPDVNAKLILENGWVNGNHRYNQSRYILFYANKNCGYVELNNVEFFTNAFINPNSSYVFQMQQNTTQSYQGISVRKSKFFAGAAPYTGFYYGAAVGTWDIPANELIIGGYADGATLYPNLNAFVSGVKTNIETISGVGTILKLAARKYYNSNIYDNLDFSKAKARLAANVNHSTGFLGVFGNRSATSFTGFSYLTDNQIFVNSVTNSVTYNQNINRSGLKATFYIGNNAILIGTTGYIARGSTMTGTFTTITSGTTETLNAGIKSSTTAGVIVGNNGTILYTSDAGLTWNSATSGTTANLNAVNFGGSTYVAVGDGGVILSSTDGITWTTRTSGTTNNLRGITYLAITTPIWIAVGNSGTIRTSTNLTTWSTATSGVNRDIISIDNDGARAIALTAFSQIQQPDLIQSTTGTSWDSGNIEVPFVAKSIYYHGARGSALPQWSICGESDYVGISYFGLNWDYVRVKAF